MAYITAAMTLPFRKKRVALFDKGSVFVPGQNEVQEVGAERLRLCWRQSGSCRSSDRDSEQSSNRDSEQGIDDQSNQSSDRDSEQGIDGHSNQSSDRDSEQGIDGHSNQSSNRGSKKSINNQTSNHDSDESANRDYNEKNNHYRNPISDSSSSHNPISKITNLQKKVITILSREQNNKLSSPLRVTSPFRKEYDGTMSSPQTILTSREQQYSYDPILNKLTALSQANSPPMREAANYNEKETTVVIEKEDNYSKKGGKNITTGEHNELAISLLKVNPETVEERRGKLATPPAVNAMTAREQQGKLRTPFAVNAMTAREQQGKLAIPLAVNAMTIAEQDNSNPTVNELLLQNRTKDLVDEKTLQLDSSTLKERCSKKQSFSPQIRNISTTHKLFRMLYNSKEASELTYRQWLSKYHNNLQFCANLEKNWRIRWGCNSLRYQAGEVIKLNSDRFQELSSLLVDRGIVTGVSFDRDSNLGVDDDSSAKSAAVILDNSPRYEPASQPTFISKNSSLNTTTHYDPASINNTALPLKDYGAPVSNLLKQLLYKPALQTICLKDINLGYPVLLDPEQFKIYEERCRVLKNWERSFAKRYLSSQLLLQLLGSETEIIVVSDPSYRNLYITEVGNRRMSALKAVFGTRPYYIEVLSY